MLPGALKDGLQQSTGIRLHHPANATGLQNCLLT